MAGGKGTRFWPKSTEEKPKQFLNLIGEKTMIQMTCDRVLKIMPIENKYSISEVKSALKDYVEMTGNRVTVEYILIHGFNDTPQVAKELAYFLKDLKCNINLIPYNSVIENDYKKPSASDIMKFKYLLEHSGKKVTVRLERGADIDAACGQLRGKRADIK